MNNSNFTAYIQKGFTLLEMVLVLFLVGLMASATLMITEGVEDQAKYDETKRRLELIRMAIIGDTTRQSNGSTEISGFAADVGRLPVCIDELFAVSESVPATPTSPAIFATCGGDASVAEWGTDASTGVSHGWRGPYLQVLAERDGDLRFRDGYLNDDESPYENNSGWGYLASGGIVSVSSAAFDINDSLDDIVQDTLITPTQWQVDQAYVRFINTDTSDAIPSLSSHELALRIYRGSNYSVTDEDDFLTFNGLSAAESSTMMFSFDSSNAIPLGVRAYEVICYESLSGDLFVFDGGCTDSSVGSPSNYVKVIPGQTLYLDWRL